MSHAACLDPATRSAILHWAAARNVALTVSVLPEAKLHNLRSALIRFDEKENLLQVLFPFQTESVAPPEIVAGQQLGIAFRRGHKKCMFVCKVLLRRSDIGPEGRPMDTLVLSAPSDLREYQRRLFQRIPVPADRFIPAKLWHGGLPGDSNPAWPLCSGRVANISAGGILMDIRAEQNPRLGVGDIVGLEIVGGLPQNPILEEAQYRHCILIGPGRIGLGLQFIGLESNLPGRSPIAELSNLINDLRKSQPAT